MDLLGITRFAVAGHDWGARAAYTLAALFPDRVVAAAALALPHQPGGLFTTPSFAQSRLLPRTLASGALRPALRRPENATARGRDDRGPDADDSGGDDRCDPPSASQGQERWFSGPYRRLVLDGVGHFPTREAPDAVAAALTSHLVEAFGL